MSDGSVFAHERCIYDMADKVEFFKNSGSLGLNECLTVTHADLGGKEAEFLALVLEKKTVGASFMQEFPSSNQDDWHGGKEEIGQSLALPEIMITTSSFFIKRLGNPSGNCVVKLYNVSGTVGVDALPTGSALGVTNEIDVTSLSTSFTKVFFAYDPVPLLSASNYAIVLEFTGTYDGSNRLDYGIDWSSPTDPGNIFFTDFHGGPYSTEITQDLIYSVTGSFIPNGLTLRSIGDNDDFRLDRVSDTETRFTKLHSEAVGQVTASILMWV